MGEKLTDLKYQVRHELMRNENIEKVPMYFRYHLFFS